MQTTLLIQIIKTEQKVIYGKHTQQADLQIIKKRFDCKNSTTQKRIKTYVKISAVKQQNK